MKCAYKIVTAMFLLVVFLLCGCSVAPDTTGAQLGNQATMKNPFSSSATTAPISAPQPSASEPADPTKPNSSMDMGMTSFGMIGNYSRDEYGHYWLYEGGQMHMQFNLGATGQSAINYAQQGIGVLMFLDGRAQPYRLSEDGELSYCHILYPTFDTQTQTYYFDTYFDPVTGQEGDALEFYAITIPNPTWESTDPPSGFMYSHGGCTCGTRLKFGATPQEAGTPTLNERIAASEITYIDATYEEIGGWSDQELLMRFEYEMFVNGDDKRIIYNLTDDDQVELQFEIWGTPYMEYGLMFYVDNHPISALKDILFDMESGKKTVITVTLSLEDFDGEFALYAALIPRNYWTTEVPAPAFLTLGSTYFLLDDPKPEG